MFQRTQELAQLVVDNRQEIAKAYKRKVVDTDQSAMSALTWALAGKKADAAAVENAYYYLKSQTKIMSAERGVSEQALVTYMAMSDDMEAYLAKVRAVYSTVMEGKKVASSGRFGEAMIIANNTETTEEAIQIAKHTEDIFTQMRETHPLITNDSDRSFATLLALSDREANALLSDAEECYRLLGDGYKMTQGRQTMANVLSLSSMPPSAKVGRIKELRDAFKANKVSIGWTSSQEYAVLALLADDDRPANEIGAEVAEINAFLKKQKGFGGLHMPGSSRVVMSSVISSFSHAHQDTTDALANAMSIAIAQAILDWIIFIVIITPII